MTRVVFDTVILVRALIRRRSVWGTLVFEHPQQYKLVVSRPVLAEYMDVLQRPELTALFHRAADRDFDFILEQLAMADRAEFSDLPRVCRDPTTTSSSLPL